MGNEASSDEIVESDETVCDDLYNAAIYGKLDEVTRLLPLAKEKGVIDKVMHGANTQREGERGGYMNYSACHNVMFISSHVCVSQIPKGQNVTALSTAARRGYDKLVSFLLAKGASPRIGVTYSVS